MGEFVIICQIKTPKNLVTIERAVIKQKIT